MGNKTGRQCKHCGSTDLVKNGKMTRWSGGKRYKIQRYICNKCGRNTFGRKEWL